MGGLGSLRRVKPVTKASASEATALGGKGTPKDRLYYRRPSVIEVAYRLYYRRSVSNRDGWGGALPRPILPGEKLGSPPEAPKGGC